MRPVIVSIRIAVGRLWFRGILALLGIAATLGAAWALKGGPTGLNTNPGLRESTRSTFTVHPIGFSGTPAASAEDSRRGGPSAPARPSGPPVIVFTYDPSGPPRFDARFPDLIVYRDGTVLSHGDPEGDTADSPGFVFQVGRPQVTAMLTRLRQLGVFDEKGSAEWANGYDLPHISLQARSRGRIVMLECHAGVDWDPRSTVCETLSDAATYLNSIAAGLSGGKPYRPRAYLLEVRRTYQQFEEPLKWRVPGIDLRGTGEGPYGELVVPPRKLRALLKVTHPYYPVFAEDGGIPYEIRWRPLYLHE